MQALLIGSEWFPHSAGGLSRYFYDAVHWLPKRGISGTALLTWLDSGQSAPMKLRPMASAGAGLRERWRGAANQTRAELAQGAELINGHFALYSFPVLRVTPRGFPVVVHFHGPYAQEMRAESPGAGSRAKAAIARSLERAVYKRAGALITLSEAFAAVLTSDYGVPRDRIHVVPGGVDLAPFSQAPERTRARQALGWPEDRTILFCVRRLVRRMGLENLVAAVALLRERDLDLMLLIAGKGPLTEDLGHQIEDLGLAANCRLLGFVPDQVLPTCYAAADLTVMPSASLEGFGLTTVESLASGTPVAGTDVGGTPEILRGLDASLISAGRDPAALAHHLAGLIGRLDTLPDRTACRQYAESYGWAEVSKCLQAIFNSQMPGRFASAPRKGLEQSA